MWSPAQIESKPPASNARARRMTPSRCCEVMTAPQEMVGFRIRGSLMSERCAPERAGLQEATQIGTSAMPMADLEWNRHDALADFERRELTFGGATRLVYVAGSGPAVIVMSEMPGIYPLVARFARWVRDAGFTVWMPHLFGEDGRPLSWSYGLTSMVRGCISREFRAFAANASSPVTDWLRALAAHAHPLCGGKGVGAI